MRRCKNCQAIMNYSYIEEAWECPCCGMKIGRVTEHGDRVEQGFEGWGF